MLNRFLQLFKNASRYDLILPRLVVTNSRWQELKELLVNIYDVLDSQRTEEPIVPFDKWEKFVEYTLDGHTYPLEEAKEDTFLPVFLKEISSRYY